MTESNYARRVVVVSVDPRVHALCRDVVVSLAGENVHLNRRNSRRFVSSARSAALGLQSGAFASQGAGQRLALVFRRSAGPGTVSHMDRGEYPSDVTEAGHSRYPSGFSGSQHKRSGLSCTTADSHQICPGGTRTRSLRGDVTTSARLRHLLKK